MHRRLAAPVQPCRREALGGGLVRFANPPLVIAGAAVFFVVGWASWKKGRPNFSFDPFQGTRPARRLLVNDKYPPGDRRPIEDRRPYTIQDVRHRLLSLVPGCELVDAPQWDCEAPDFSYGGCQYTFATLVRRRAR